MDDKPERITQKRAQKDKEMKNANDRFKQYEQNEKV